MNPIAEIIRTEKGKRIYVDEFKCHDGGMMEKLGQHVREAEWNVVTGSKENVRVKVHEDSGLVHGKKVAIEVSDGKTAGLIKIWPYKGDSAKMTEDVTHSWTFQGENPNTDVEGHFEAKPWNKDEYLPCVLKESNPDDTHTVDLIITLPNGLQKTERAENVPSYKIREVGSHTILSAPPRVLTLKAPADDPVSGAKLTLDGKDITKNFSRPTPSKKCDKVPTIKFVVSKDNEKITCDYGHDVVLAQKDSMLHLLPSESSGKESKIWKFRVGAFGDHDVQIQKKGAKHIELSVDGALFVSASAADLGCQQWRCEFTLVGKPEFVFQVHKQSMDGRPLKDTVDETVKLPGTKINCVVVVPYIHDLQQSVLMLNGQECKTLPLAADGVPEYMYNHKMEMHPRAFHTQYNLEIPHCVDENAPSGWGMSSGALDSSSGALDSTGHAGQMSFMDWLSRICPFCSSAPQVAADTHIS